MEEGDTYKANQYSGYTIDSSLPDAENIISGIESTENQATTPQNDVADDKKVEMQLPDPQNQNDQDSDDDFEDFQEGKY